MDEEFKQYSPYKERLAQIYSSPSPVGFRKHIGMHDIYEFDELFGRKHKLFKTIHVTGTNGKGSACIKIGSALCFAGYKVGRLISPHISCCRERITLNNELISEADFVKCTDTVFGLLKENSHIQLKFSEKLFFIALAYFALKEVDVAVIQVGVGGKYDATNVITPVISVITSVSLDHIQLLGPTVEDIAREKSGIIKPKVPCVLGPKAQPKQIFLEVAQAQDSPVFCVDLSAECESFKSVNGRIVKLCLELLQAQQFTQLNEHSISKGIEQNQPCRMEQVSSKLLSQFLNLERVDNMEVVLDVAHNPGGITALVDYYVSKKKEVWGVCGFSKMKKHQEILHYLLDNLNSLFFISNSHFKIVKASELLSLAQEVKKTKESGTAALTLISNGDIKETLEDVLGRAASKENIIVLIFGSFFLMEEVRAALGFQDIRDETDINYNANQLMK